MLRVFTTTLGQILAIIAISSALTFLLFIVFLFYSGKPPNPPWPWQSAYRIISIVEVLERTPKDTHQLFIEAAQRPDMRLRLTQAPVPCPILTLDTHDLEAVLQAELQTLPNVTVRSCEEDGAIQTLIPLGDRTLEVRSDKLERSPPRITFPLLSALLFACVGVVAMSAWAVWRVIGPLRRLSEQADAFGRDIALSPIAEEGPLEIRRAARAFNLMQERITRSMEDRTRMLAAISHDLRTPLTRMRLHLDTNEPAIARAKLLRDLGLMQSMVSSALAYLSAGFDAEDKEWLDLGALLSTLCDEYEESGAHVRYEGPRQIPFFCRPNAISRALGNLVENAIHFGDHTVISASTPDGRLVIDVADDGPGIPQELRREVVEPFVRLDPSRSNRAGSVGLGLSIVKDVAERHGGTLTLHDRPPHGLIARLTFPYPVR